MHLIIRMSEGAQDGSLLWLMWTALGLFAGLVFIGWLVSRSRDAGGQEREQDPLPVKKAAGTKKKQK